MLLGCDTIEDSLEIPEGEYKGRKIEEGMLEGDRSVIILLPWLRRFGERLTFDFLYCNSLYFCVAVNIPTDLILLNTFTT